MIPNSVQDCHVYPDYVLDVYMRASAVRFPLHGLHLLVKPVDCG